MLSRVMIMNMGQTLVASGDNPSVHTNGDSAKVVFPYGDGKIIASTVRLIAEETSIQAIHWGPFGIIVLQKED